MNDNGAKQQIVDKVKNTSNILVTVSTNPSVDELSAALGLTVLLNKMDKHATAVFSGQVPPAITFLDPQKTFENTVDSLRDFIIALNKEKADHLRYKVDGDVVKIFITPYKTTISSDDLEFSQGDYNVELVLGLGVKDRDDLDNALKAHGRILHDATVATLTNGETISELGSIDWHEDNASSLSEMLVGLADALKGDKALLDEQIATAFLTGIVAATDRFSNNKTSSRVMTIAAQLMSAGANQQLIASKLEEAHEIGENKKSDSKNSDGTTDLSEGQSTKLKKQSKSKKSGDDTSSKKDDGALVIPHNQEPEKPVEDDKVSSVETNTTGQAAEDTLAQQLQNVAPAAASAATPSVADLQKDLAQATEEVNEAAEKRPETVASVPAGGQAVSEQWQNNETPSMGGTLNATTEQAAEDKKRELEDTRNRTILTHGNGNSYVGDSTPTFQSPLNAASAPSEDQAFVDPFKDLTPPIEPDSAPTMVAQPIAPPTPALEPAKPSETLADIDRENRTQHEDARAAVDAAFGAVPFSPAGNPLENVGSQPLGTPISHTDTSPVSMPESVAPSASSLPPVPPLPDFSTLPPLPTDNQGAPMGALSPEKLEDVFKPATGSAPSPVPPQPADPGQFKIPGQS